MKRTLFGLLTILFTACSGTTEPATGLGSLTGEWYAQYAPPDLFAEWNLSLTELSTGYVAGTFTLTSYGSLAPPSRRRTLVDTGRVAGEHSGIDVALLFIFDEREHQSRYEGRQVEANIFRVEGEGGTLDFVRVDPS